MEIAYFNLTDMAERVKYLLTLKTNTTEDFEKNQIRSIASAVAQRTRLVFTYRLLLGLLLTVSNPIFYPNPSPVPIAISDPSEAYPRFFLQLTIRCTQECYIWCFCSSAPNELTEVQIQEMGMKYIVMGDIDCLITFPLTEQSYGTVYIHLVAQSIMGSIAITHTSVPFVLSNQVMETNEISSSLSETPLTSLVPTPGTTFLSF